QHVVELACSARDEDEPALGTGTGWDGNVLLEANGAGLDLVERAELEPGFSRTRFDVEGADGVAIDDQLERRDVDPRCSSQSHMRDDGIGAVNFVAGV